MQHNMPRTWSRHPTAGQQQLPAYFFSSSSTGNECEFVVDVERGREVEHEEDVFPTGDVVFVGRYIVQACLVGEVEEEGTVGSDIVGPRGVMRLRLRKKGVDGGAAGGYLQLVNRTLLHSNESDRTMLMRTLDEAENVGAVA